MIVLVLLFAVMLAGCGTEPAELPVYNTVPSFQLIDQTGEVFDSQARLAGRVWVANFIFTTCPGPCPRMSSRMRYLQGELSDLPEVKLVSFTVDPERDTPEVLARYAAQYEAEPGRWFFLTGPRETLHSLSRDAFMLGDVKGTLDHSTRFVLVDGEGRVRGYYASYETDEMDKLLADLRRLVQESGGPG